MDDTNKKILKKLAINFNSLISPKLIISFDSLDEPILEYIETINSETLQNRYFDQLDSFKAQKLGIIKVFSASIKKAIKHFINGQYEYLNEEGKSEKKQDSLAGLSLSLIEDNSLEEHLTIANLASKCEINCNTNLFQLEQRFAKLANVSALSTKQIPITPTVLIEAYKKSIESVITKVDIDAKFKQLLYKNFDTYVLRYLNECYHEINSYLSSKGIIEHVSFNVHSNQTEQSGFNDQEFNNLDEKVATINPKEKLTLEEIEEVEEVEEVNQADVNELSEIKIIEPTNSDSSYKIISNLLKNKLSSIGSKLAEGLKSINNTFEVSPDIFDSSNSLNQTEGSRANITDAHDQATDVNALLKTLTNLQVVNTSNLILTERNKTPEDIRSDFINELNKSENNAIKRQDMESIDLIVLLFKYIVDDRNLPDAIQVILSHLQIPYLKIALHDNNLFADKSHPARILLNNLSVESVGYSKETDEDKSYINTIKTISKKILDHEKYEENYFNDLIKEFDTFNNQRNLKIQEIQNQTNQSLYKKEKLNQAKKIVAELLVNKMTNKKMPKLFKDILLGSWLYILVLTDIKHNRMSFEYKEKVRFIDNLIDLAHPNSKIDKLQIDYLLKQYLKGIRLITFDKNLIREKLIALKKLLLYIHFNLSIVKQQAETKAEIVTKKEVVTEAETELDFAQHEIIDLAEIRNHEFGIISNIEEQEEESSLDLNITFDEEKLDIVKAMRVGDWVIFNKKLRNGEPIKAKLSWISPITGKFLFVLADGLKFNEVFPQHIALGIDNKSISLVDSEPIFDRAISAIADALQEASN